MWHVVQSTPSRRRVLSNSVISRGIPSLWRRENVGECSTNLESVGLRLPIIWVFQLYHYISREPKVCIGNTWLSSQLHLYDRGQRSRPTPETRILVFFMLTRSPLLSMRVFQVFKLAIHSSKESAKTAKSSAYKTSI